MPVHTGSPAPRLSGRRRLIALDAIEKVRRHQHCLQRRGDALLERIALLARKGDVSEVLVHFPGVAGRRNARRRSWSGSCARRRRCAYPERGRRHKPCGGSRAKGRSPD